MIRSAYVGSTTAAAKPSMKRSILMRTHGGFVDHGLWAQRWGDPRGILWGWSAVTLAQPLQRPSRRSTLPCQWAIGPQTWLGTRSGPLSASSTGRLRTPGRRHTGKANLAFLETVSKQTAFASTGANIKRRGTRGTQPQVAHLSRPRGGYGLCGSRSLWPKGPTQARPGPGWNPLGPPAGLHPDQPVGSRGCAQPQPHGQRSTPAERLGRNVPRPTTRWHQVSVGDHLARFLHPATALPSPPRATVLGGILWSPLGDADTGLVFPSDRPAVGAAGGTNSLSNIQQTAQPRGVT